MRRLLAALLILVGCSARPGSNPPAVASWAVQAQPAQLDFGAVPVGQAADLPLDLQNSMSVGTEVDLSTDDPTFVVDPQKLELAAGARARVTISWRPGARGRTATLLHLAPCPGCKGPAVDLSGTGLIEHFALDPSPLDFGLQRVGVTACRDVAVNNDGDLPIVFASIEPDSQFKLDGALDLGAGALLDGSPIAPRASASFHICFDPATRGKAYRGTLTLTTVGHASASLTIVGTGVGPRLATFPMDLDLGVGEPFTAVAGPVLLQNIGDAGSLVIRTVRVDGGDPALQLAFPDGDPVGRDVGAGSFRIQAVMNGAFGEHEGTIVVEATDGETASVHVHGVAVERSVPCNLEFPEAVAFGMVHYQNTYTRDVTIVNTNPTAACFVWGFGLDPVRDPNPSDRFSVSGAPAGITSIPAGGKLKLTVTYASAEASIDPDTQTLSFKRVTGVGMSDTVKVPISGFATQLDLSFSPDPIDFGTVPVGAPVHVTVALTNHGTRLIKIGGNMPSPNPGGDIAMSTDSAPGFAVYKTPSRWPQTLPGGGTMTFSVVFRAQAPGHYEGTLEVWLQNSPEAIRVPVIADAVGPACVGDLCVERIAECPIALTGPIGAAADLGGRVFQQHPTGTITCQWTVLHAPAGSSAAIEPGSACDGKLTPDVVGDYEVQLSATDDAGWTGACQTKVTATDNAGLIVQTTWDWPEDLDLYLFHGPDDSNPCDYLNQHPSWDSPGQEDDPMLLADDQTGQGPEVIEVPVPGAETYWIGVHWYGDGHGEGTVNATTRITCRNAEVAEVQSVLHNYDLASVGSVTRNGDGTCSFTPDGRITTVTP